MSDQIEVIEVGGPPVTIVSVNGTAVTGVVTTGVPVGATTLDQLTDVDGAAGGTTGQVLTRAGDGQWRPATSGTGSYVHTQTIAQAVWTIAHGMGRYPVAWSLVDSTGRLCDNYEVSHVDLNSSLVSMDIPTAGVLRLI